MLTSNLLRWGFMLVAVITIASCGSLHKKKRYLKDNYKILKESFPDAQVTMLQDSIKVIFPNNLVFDIGAANLKSTFEVKLNRFAEILNKYNKTNLLVNGYTDNTGTEESNLQLSLNRAENVKKYLVAQTVPENRLFTWGLGEKSPIASNETTEGQAQNRRVEFIVLYSPKE